MKKRKTKKRKLKRLTPAEAEAMRRYAMYREPPAGSIIPLDMPIMRLVRG